MPNRNKFIAQILARSVHRFVFGRLALLVHGEQRSGLRGRSVVGRGYRLVAVRKRGRHNHVELKFARRNKTGERDLRG